MQDAIEPNIGVLALQGDVREHLAALESCGARAVKVRTVEELKEVDGLIIPGGESSTVGMLLERYGVMEPLRERIEAGLPVFGTCTGLILMAKEIEGSGQPRIGCMDVAVQRNAYGRQVDSFETSVEALALGIEPLRAVFIRAPKISRTGPEVEVLAETEGGPILVRQNHLLAASFHPELTADRRVHRLFIEMTQEGR
jgi:pyridoxal 5'-phosphate synthase pdxT subunit